MKLLHVMLLLPVLVLGSDVARGAQKETFRDDKVTAGEVTTLAGLLSPHVGHSKYIEVFGVVYKDVTGSEPYYIGLPTLDSILFVTAPLRGDAYIHIVNLKTKEHRPINLKQLYFGRHIGRTPGKKRPEEYVKFLSIHKLVVVSELRTRRTTIEIDLDRKEVSKVEIVNFD